MTITKILLCDDESDVLRLNKILFEAEGYDIVTSSNGKDCIEKAKSEKPDHIFLDIMMPGMDGWETLKELKKDEKLKHIPVTMLTVEPIRLETYKQEYVGKLVDYIVKPFNKKDLLHLIKHCL